MTTITQKIYDGYTLTDGEILSFFDLPARYNEQHRDHGLSYDSDYDTDIAALLGDVASQYDYGGDIRFWVIDNYYVEQRTGNEWYVEQFDGEYANNVAASAIAAYYSDDTSVPEALSLFGLDDQAIKYLDIAEDDNQGPCKVWVRHNYYANHIARAQHSNWAMSDNDFEPLVFATVADAKTHIAECKRSPYGDDTYVLNQGESSPPDYYICEA